MDSKTKIALLIPCLMAMHILISSKVAMAARNFEEGEFVKERNEAGDARLVNDDFKIPDIGNRGFGGTFGSIPGVGSIPSIIGGIIPGFGSIIPDIIGNFIPGIGGGIIPGTVGGIGGGFPGIGGGGIPRYGGYGGQGGYRGGLNCPYYGCCAWALEGGYCTSCCTI